MKHLSRFFGTVALVAAAALAFTACDSSGGDDGPPPPPPYIITDSGTTFTATLSGSTIEGADGVAIGSVISAIRTHAEEDDIRIQFGSGGANVLDIGTASVSFNNTGSNWGQITLSGGITSANAAANSGTIVVMDDVTITSTANIANTAADENGRAIYHNSTGTLNINGGKVEAGTGQAINIATGGLVNVSGNAEIAAANTTAGTGTIVLAHIDARLYMTGGKVSNTQDTTSNESNAILNSTSTQGIRVGTTDNDAIRISGGTVDGNNGHAIRINAGGRITISEDNPGVQTIITSEKYSQSDANAGTISLRAAAARLYMTGGRVENTRPSTATNPRGDAIFMREPNNAEAIVVSGGIVESITGAAIWSMGSGRVNISGTALITSSSRPVAATEAMATIIHGSTIGGITISGGTVRNTTSQTNGRAINNSSSAQALVITGGTIDGNIGTAIWSMYGGVITISEDNPEVKTIITSVNTNANQGTIRLYDTTAGTLTITSGRVENTAAPAPNAHAITRAGSQEVRAALDTVIPRPDWVLPLE